MDTLIARYYLAFNERRFADAAQFVADEAEIQHRPGAPLRGPAGYVASARMATTSFPDIRLDVIDVTWHGDWVAEVALVATGTHVSDWIADGIGTLKASGATRTFRIRETLEIRGGKITFSSLNYNLQDLFGPSGKPT